MNGSRNAENQWVGKKKEDKQIPVPDEGQVGVSTCVVILDPKHIDVCRRNVFLTALETGGALAT